MTETTETTGKICLPCCCAGAGPVAANLAAGTLACPSC